MPAMDTLLTIYLLTGILTISFLLQFCFSSLREKKYRTFYIGVIITVILGLFWYGSYRNAGNSGLLAIILESIVVLAALLFFLPFKKPSKINIEETTEKVDERDVIFAREEYYPGTEKYESYYKMRPEKKNTDDQLRLLPELLQPGGRYYDPIYSRYIDSNFAVLRKLSNDVDGEVASDKAEVDPRLMSEELKGFVLKQGAAAAGMARLNPAYLYSNVGRGPEKWGAPIANNHKYAIMFTLEMRYDYVAKAPLLPITDESAKQYINAAVISIQLAAFIRSLGYSARAHIAGSNYQIMMPPVAYDAGLGELGRIGYLISPGPGARVRLGGVTTDIPLIPDKPITFGVQDFCEKCLKCAENCPSGAITRGSRVKVKGANKWPLDSERCLRYWRLIGTDCGLCMKVCPYSHPQTLVHNVVRAGIKRSPFARHISIYADDLLYGRKVRNA